MPCARLLVGVHPRPTGGLWGRRDRRSSYRSDDGSCGRHHHYYAFFSVFPLLLAFVSIVGFVLQDGPSRRDDILNSADAELPVVGPLLRGDIGTIGGSGLALAVGIGVALWAGLGITLALGQALDATWNVAPVEQLGYVARRVRGLAMLVTAGLAIVTSSVLSGAATSGHMGARRGRRGCSRPSSACSRGCRRPPN